MTEATTTAFQAVQNAKNALQQGDKVSARHWAEIAVQLAPEREEPWLLLAAIAKPQASVGYLRQALKLNPESPRALAGLEWALKRLETARQTALTVPLNIVETTKTPVSLANIAPSAGATTQKNTRLPEKARQTARTAPLKIAETIKTPFPAAKVAPMVGAATQKLIRQPEKARQSRAPFLFILVPLVLIAIIVFITWSATPAFAFFSGQAVANAGERAQSWAQVNILNATLTDTPTATLTPLPTFTSTPANTSTPVASPTPEESPTPEISPTPLPTDAGPVANASQSNASAEELAKTYTGNKWILVDISEQHMYVYEGDTLVYSFVASTGMNNATRVGTFAVQSKIPNAWGSTWSIWMPSWLGIYYAGSMENGIHALPILPNGATLWAGYLGTPISYGCVVLGSYEAQVLYDWADIGTPVIIQR